MANLDIISTLAIIIGRDYDPSLVFGMFDLLPNPPWTATLDVPWILACVLLLILTHWILKGFFRLFEVIFHV